MPWTASEAERVKAIEVKQEAMGETLEDVSRKLDDLLAIKNRGLGAFWLASALAGTGILGFIGMIIEWIKS